MDRNTAGFNSIAQLATVREGDNGIMETCRIHAGDQLSQRDFCATDIEVGDDMNNSNHGYMLSIYIYDFLITRENPSVLRHPALIERGLSLSLLPHFCHNLSYKWDRALFPPS